MYFSYDSIKKYKKVIENCSWLYIIQFFNYIFPLITIPYILRTIGIANYGVLAIIQAIIGYIAIIVDFGFSLTSTRKIANARANMNAIEHEYNNVFVCKLGLACCCFVCAIFCFLCVNVSADFLCFFIFYYGTIIGSIFFPEYFFQGMEDMKYITIMNGVSQILFCVLLFLIVRTESDFIYIAVIRGSISIILGFFVYKLIEKKYYIKLSFSIDTPAIMSLLKEGKPVFLANCCGNIYGQGSTIITGYFAGSMSAGYFALGMKVSSAIANLVNPIVRAIYPELCRRYDENKKNFYMFLKKILAIFLGGDVFCVIILGLAAGLISFLLKGTYDAELIFTLRAIFFVTAGTMLNVFLHPFILSMGKFKEIQWLYFVISMIFLAISIPLTFYLQHLGMIISLVVVEYSIAIAYVYIIQKEKKNCNL